MWLWAVLLNTLYSYAWDVTMDWGLAVTPHPTLPFLRPRLLYSSPVFYYIAMLVNLALRFCWSLELSPHLQARPASLVHLALITNVRRRRVLPCAV